VEEAIIIFDGFCNFCSRSVKFIMDHDPEGYFMFTPLQSPRGKKIQRSYKFDADLLDTLILLEKGKIYTHSTALLRIARRLKGFPRWFFPLIVLPSPIRDFFYKCFARYRYKLFGMSEHCFVPTEDERNRFG
jgi:predicted DCC family thiol-disulfide oxidoreductase YuxK